MKNRNLLAVAASFALAVPAFAAGDVLVSMDGSTLRIVGDAVDNDVVITSVGSALTVTGANGTTVNSLASFTIPSARSVFAEMGAGADRVEFNGTAIRGDVRLRLDDGDDTVLMNAVNVRGRTAIRGGSGADRVTLQGTSFFRSAFALRMQDGNDSVNLDGADFRLLVRVDTGEGNDDLIVNECNFGGSARLEVEMRDGDDTVHLNDSEFDDDVEVDLGRDDDRLTIQDADFNNDVTGTGGGGNDDLDLESGNDFRRRPRFNGFDD